MLTKLDLMDKGTDASDVLRGLVVHIYMYTPAARLLALTLTSC